MKCNLINITNDEERLVFLNHLQNKRVAYIESPIIKKKLCLHPIYEKELDNRDFLKGVPDSVPYTKNKNSSVFYVTNPLHITAYMLKGVEVENPFLERYKKYASVSTFNNEYITKVNKATSLDEVCLTDKVASSVKYVKALNKTFGYDIATEIADTIHNGLSKEWIYYKNSVKIIIRITTLQNGDVIGEMYSTPRTGKLYHYKLINERIFVGYNLM